MPSQKVTFNVIQISGCMLSWRWYESSLRVHSHLRFISLIRRELLRDLSVEAIPKLSTQSIIELFSPCKSWPNSECLLSITHYLADSSNNISYLVNRKCERTLSPINLPWKLWLCTSYMTINTWKLRHQTHPGTICLHNCTDILCCSANCRSMYLLRQNEKYFLTENFAPPPLPRVQ